MNDLIAGEDQHYLRLAGASLPHQAVFSRSDQRGQRPWRQAALLGGQYVLQSFFQLLRLQVSFSSLLLIKRTCCTMFNMTENSFFSLKKNLVGKICITREKWSIVMKAAKSQKMLSICSHFQKTQMSVIFPTSSFL